MNSVCILKNIMTPLERREKKVQKMSLQLLLLSHLKGQGNLVAYHQLSSRNKWSFAINMDTVQPMNKPETFLQGRRTCLNGDPCRAQADHKYFKFLLPLLVTQPLLLRHLMLRLGCITCLGSAAHAGSCSSFAHQPAAAAALSFSNIPALLLFHTSPQLEGLGEGEVIYREVLTLITPRVTEERTMELWLPAKTWGSTVPSLSSD